MKTLILGGIRSGKSDYAESLIENLDPPYTYIATAEAFDNEMQQRIIRHQKQRDARWQTLEAAYDLPKALANVGGAVLVDDVSLWLSNVLLAEKNIGQETEALLTAVKHYADPLVLVSAEVGLSLVSNNVLGRQFTDALGLLNQRLAKICTVVTMVTAGLPQVLKS